LAGFFAEAGKQEIAGGCLSEASNPGWIDRELDAVAQVEAPVAVDITAKATIDPTAGNRRWVILGFIFLITVINFVDRQTLSVLAPVLEKALHFTDITYGRIVAALQFGMMTGEFPMGMLMDRWGAKLGMSLAVGWWSAATGMQFFARTGVTFGATRFWMGTGECGNYSGGIKTVTRLFKKEERTLAIGIFNSASMVGSTIATPLIVYLLLRYGFRTAFLVPALLGFLWIPLWWFFYGKEPKVEENAESKISSREMLKLSESWAVMFCRFFIGPVMQFYWYWMPSYLFSVRHMSMKEVGILGWIPFAFGGVGGVAGGWVAGILQQRGMSILNVRRVTMYSSGLLCVTSLLVPRMTSIKAALLMIGLAIFADNFISANMFGAITDLFTDKQVGRATGLTGVAQGVSGFLFPLLTGWLVERSSYAPVFVCVAFMPLAGALALFVIARKNYAALDKAQESELAAL
jgi:ACS family hexuronate transporter-like MFS transporter